MNVFDYVLTLENVNLQDTKKYLVLTLLIDYVINQDNRGEMDQQTHSDVYEMLNRSLTIFGYMINRVVLNDEKIQMHMLANDLYYYGIDKVR